MFISFVKLVLHTVDEYCIFSSKQCSISTCLFTNTHEYYKQYTSTISFRHICTLHTLCYKYLTKVWLSLI